ncbi:MAG: hypothetical protein KGM17_15795 [Sphingomonadales bacterium]|nr:hypothetical protein [Sphingomonadales bacterium]
MSIRFAAAGSGECAIVTKVLTRPSLTRPANDTEAGLGRDALLRATLRHFAAWGLQAAERARDNAEAAYFEGRRDEYQHWLAICRTLDRRLAAGAVGARGRQQI